MCTDGVIEWRTDPDRPSSMNKRVVSCGKYIIELEQALCAVLGESSTDSPTLEVLKDKAAGIIRVRSGESEEAAGARRE